MWKGHLKRSPYLRRNSSIMLSVRCFFCLREWQVWWWLSPECWAFPTMNAASRGNVRQIMVIQRGVFLSFSILTLKKRTEKQNTLYRFDCSFALVKTSFLLWFSKSANYGELQKGQEKESSIFGLLLKWWFTEAWGITKLQWHAMDFMLVMLIITILFH